MNVTNASAATGMSSSGMPICWNSRTPNWTIAGAPC